MDDEINLSDENEQGQQSVSKSEIQSDGQSGSIPGEPQAATLPDSESPDDAHAHLLPFPIVGIGASAGGIEAYIDLFKHLPHDTGMAFVLVPHLAPDLKSHLSDVLAPHTSMPITQVEGDTHPKTDHVYVLPPNSFITLSKGVLKLEPRPQDTRIPMPIDHFFRSMAADQKTRAVGVVLSGMDSDGALGLRAIKGEGGIAIVQDPESARFPSMPRSSIAADHVDLIVPPPRIASELARLGRQFVNPDIARLQKTEIAETDERAVTRIFGLLRAISGIEFSRYRPQTIQRRIARRMFLKRYDSLPEYLVHLQTHPDELRALQEDLLINVTRFFRDPEVFEALKEQVFPAMFESRPQGQQVRIWAAGCSTGEEVYSIAISLLEFLSANAIEEPSIQIFGTDASEPSIMKARLGIYPETISADVSPERLRRFFIKSDKRYQVAKRLRDLCIFARQNLCTDPPFSKLDLVVCRNVLIYFNQSLQKQILPTFHYSLRSNGYLLLGQSETIREFADLFSQVDRRYKIYAKIPGPPRVGFELPRRVLMPGFDRDVQPAVLKPENWAELDLQRAVDRLVLARFGPPGVVVDRQLNIVLTRGHTSPYFEMTPGTPSLHLFRMLRVSIAAQVRDAALRSIEENIPVRVEGLQARNGEEGHEFTLEVLPIQGPGANCYLLLFVEEPRKSATSTRPSVDEDVTGDRDVLIAQLRQDLMSTKLYMQSLLEERDAKNQELISANEEIQSQNEELQSTNEELETTKEEVQSANEELQTVNEELQKRNSALAQAGNDLANLLNGVNLPVLMLSNDLEIRQFTPPIQEVMNVRNSDIGRPLREIRSQLSVENLEPLAQEVLATLVTKELEIQDRNDHWYLMRIRPYRTVDNKIDGVVLVLIDIDHARRTQQAVRDARDFAVAVIESVQVPLVVLNPDMRIRTANSAFRSIAQEAGADLTGRLFPDVAALLWRMDTIREQLESLSKQGPGARFEMEHEVRNEHSAVLLIQGLTVRADGEVVLLLLMEDITLPRRSEQLLTEERNRLKIELEAADRELRRIQQELRRLAGSLFTSQEDERRRVARELHDDITQKLGLLEINLEQLAKEAGPELRPSVDSFRQQIAALTEDVRRMSHRLHPSILEDLGLSFALKALLEEFGEAEGMPVTFQQSQIPESIPREVAACLYRIAQEALRNVAKHAGRTHVKIALDGTNQGIRMEVRDFGHGFDPEDAGGGLGLISMTERARLVEGVLTVQSALGKGTTITVDVPLAGEPEAA